MCAADGPPLPVDLQLRGVQESQVFLPPPFLCLSGWRLCLGNDGLHGEARDKQRRPGLE